MNVNVSFNNSGGVQEVIPFDVPLSDFVVNGTNMEYRVYTNTDGRYSMVQTVLISSDTALPTSGFIVAGAGTGVNSPINLLNANVPYFRSSTGLQTLNLLNYALIYPISQALAPATARIKGYLIIYKV